MVEVIEADNEVVSLLEQNLGSSEESGQGKWVFGGVDEGKQINAQIGAGWLTLDCKLGQGLSEIDPWAKLQKHREFGSNVRYAVDRHDGELHLRSDLPLKSKAGGNKEMEGSIDRFCLAFTEALNGSNGQDSEAEAGEIEPGEIDLKEYCHEAGWAYAERAGGELSVKLEVKRAPFRAILSSNNDGDVCMKVKLIKHPSDVDEVNHRAVGLLLLLSCGVVRSVRAVVSSQASDESVAGFEVCVPHLNSCDELNEGLSALSVACNVCGAEAELLYKNKTIAESYLRCFSNFHKLN